MKRLIIQNGQWRKKIIHKTLLSSFFGVESTLKPWTMTVLENQASFSLFFEAPRQSALDWCVNNPNDSTAIRRMNVHRGNHSLLIQRGVNEKPIWCKSMPKPQKFELQLHIHFFFFFLSVSLPLEPGVKLSPVAVKLETKQQRSAEL